MMRDPVEGRGQVVVESFGSESGETASQRESIDENLNEKIQHQYQNAAVTTLKNSYPLKLMVPSKASNSNCVWVYPITFGGGMVSGDRIEMDFHVKTSCALLVTGQESTKVYHCEDNLSTHLTTSGRIDKGGLLCVLSDPVVCYKDSYFNQSQEFRLNSEGNLVYLDWLLGGRVALGEMWHLRSYHNKTDVLIDDILMYRDNYHLCDSGSVSVKQTMRSMQVLGCCIILGNKMRSIATNLHKLFGKKHNIGEKFEEDLLHSVSPLQYKVGEKIVTGLYIRFMAASTKRAYDGVISHVVKELEPVIGGNPFENKY